jgi:polysaccharide deacetylase 2 family uncharacterized protein YibQ
MRGFYGGVLCGLVICAGGLAALSLLSPLAPTPEVTPVAQNLDVPETGDVGFDGVGTDPAIDATTPDSPVRLDPDPGVLDSVSRIDNQVTARPDFVDPSELPSIPTGEDALPVRPVDEVPLAPAGDAGDALPAPSQEGGIRMDSNQFGPPKADDAAGRLNELAGPDVTTRQERGIVNVPERRPETNSAPRLVVRELRSAVAPRAISVPAATIVTATVPQLTRKVRIDVPAVPSAEGKTPPNRTPASMPAPLADDAVQQAELAQLAPLPQINGRTGAGGPTIGTPVLPLTERGAPVSDGRKVALAPPVERFAAPFANPDGKPLMSIILIDDDVAESHTPLQDAAYPLSIAIDPAATGAADRMATHREAGREVLVLVDLPRTFSASDAEVTLAAGFNILSEAVAILEAAGMQASRDQSAQLVAFAKGTGRGLVTRPIGLNLTRRMAEQNGVPSAPVFRDFGGSDADPARMQRFLESALIRAGQQGSVIVIGRLHPGTVEALNRWVAQNRADRVALAPVSAVLRQGL